MVIVELFKIKYKNQRLIILIYLPLAIIVPHYLGGMPVEIITKADLEEFRVKLLENIKGLLGGKPDEQKKCSNINTSFIFNETIAYISLLMK